MAQKKRLRQENILSELRSRPSTRLGELAAQFRVSKETIRRDISELSTRGLVARTYGGALPSHLNYEPAMRERTRLNPEGRRRMAEVAVGLVKDARVIMIDTGATMSHVCDRLAATIPRDERARLTVITNGIQNLMILSQNPGIRTVLCPGVYEETESALFGSLTLEFIAGFHADALLTSASGVGPERVMDANSDAAAIKRAMLRQSGRNILVVDSQKFNYPQFETVCPMGQLDDLITDAAPPDDIGQAAERFDVHVHIAG
jgi:DeoR/GlpR family transcriptional regulator of sugar metabolism